MEGEWSCYRGGQFNGGGRSENGHVTEVASLMEGEWSLQRWLILMEGEWPCYRSLYWREVASLMEGEWSCYRGGHFNGGRMVMLWRWLVQEGEWSCY